MAKDIKDKIIDGMLEALKKEELGKKITLTFDRPDSSVEPNNLKSKIEEIFENECYFGESLLVCDAYDYESGGIAKQQLWYEDLEVKVDENVTVSFSAAAKYVFEIGDDDWSESYDITAKMFDKIAETEAVLADFDDDDDDYDGGFADTIIGEGGFTMHHIGGGIYCDDDGDNWEF